jgi:hypothetical protein
MFGIEIEVRCVSVSSMAGGRTGELVQCVVCPGTSTGREEIDCS